MRKDNDSRIYMMDNDYSYANHNPKEKSDTVITLLDMANGGYTVRVFDTQNGVVCGTFDVNASGGQLKISVPAWSSDLALLIEQK